MKEDEHYILGQIVTISSIISASPHINEDVRLAAHRLADRASNWACGQVGSHAFLQELEHLTHELSLLIA